MTYLSGPQQRQQGRAAGRVAALLAGHECARVGAAVTARPETRPAGGQPETLAVDIGGMPGEGRDRRRAVMGGRVGNKEDKVMKTVEFR